LVSEDIRSGASLVTALLASNFRVSAALWIHDPNTDDWRLVIASPEVQELGKERSYRRVQEVLQKGDVPARIDLSRVILLSDEDPEVEYLRSLSRGERATSLVIPFSERIVAGRAVDSGYLYEAEVLSYVRDVSASLQRVAPLGAMIRSNVALPDAEYDFIVDNSYGPVFIELKATAKPLSTADLERIVARKMHGPFSLLLISRSGLTHSAEQRAAQIDRRFKWVRWASRADDERLREVLNELLGPR
jgi:hypothetical protein